MHLPLTGATWRQRGLGEYLGSKLALTPILSTIFQELYSLSVRSFNSLSNHMKQELLESTTYR